MELFIVLFLSLFMLQWAAQNGREADPEESLEARARRVHDEAIVIDTHADTTQLMADPEWDFMKRHDRGHLDYPRLREGGLNALFLAVYMPRQNPDEPGIAVKKALEQIDRIRSLPERHPDRLVLALTASDIRRIVAAGRTALLIGVEGGHIIDNSLETLRCYFRLGARYMTLTHAFHHDWADSAGFRETLPPGVGGLTDFGREVIREMNRLGMMVDISHVSDETFRQTLEVSKAPLVATHSGARALCDSPRNLSDDMIRALASRGGVVQVVFFPGFLDPDYRAKYDEAKRRRQPREDEIRERFKEDPARLKEALDRLAREIPVAGSPLSLLIDHIEHIIETAGPDHVGLGADWDGVQTLMEGVEDCSRIPRVTRALLERGFSDETVTKILGQNLLRVMEEVEKTAGPRSIPETA